jgi:hypothetical protein
MTTITPAEIAALTPQEQRHMSRWIGEHSHLAELRAAARRRRTVQQEIDAQEQGVNEWIPN